MHIIYVYVTPKYCGKGYARKILRYAVKYMMKKYGFKKVEVSEPSGYWGKVVPDWTHASGGEWTIE